MGGAVSRLSFSPSPLGTGVFTLAVPNSNVDRTLTIPDQTGTMLSIAADGAVNNTSGVVSLGGGQVVKTAGGNLLVGTTTDDTAKLALNGAANSRINLRAADTRYGTIFADPSVFAISSITAIPLILGTNDTERARVSDISFLLGTSAQWSGNASRMVIDYQGGVTEYGLSLRTANTGTSRAINFLQGGASNGAGTVVVVGNITTTTTATTYNTTSDYRLKTFIAKVTDAGTRIDTLNPVEYEWKADGKRTRGFFAHEFQEVYADSVTGTKDAVDEEGNHIYQSMQASSSEVIADLVAEIQSLRKRVAALESKQ